jgi:hypothetical protein
MLLLTHPKASVKQRERIPQPTPELGPISNRDLDRVVLAGDVTISTTVVRRELASRRRPRS